MTIKQVKEQFIVWIIAVASCFAVINFFMVCAVLTFKVYTFWNGVMK